MAGGKKVSYNVSGVNVYSDGEKTGRPASSFHLQTNENRFANPASSSKTCAPFFSPDEIKRGGKKAGK